MRFNYDCIIQPATCFCLIALPSNKKSSNLSAKFLSKSHLMFILIGYSDDDNSTRHLLLLEMDTHYS